MYDAIVVGARCAGSPTALLLVDIDTKRVTEARTAAAGQGLNNVRFETASVLSLPFANDSFDAAFLSSMCEHLQDPLTALRELVRVVKPGGVIGVRDHEPSGMLVAPYDPLFREMLDWCSGTGPTRGPTSRLPASCAGCSTPRVCSESRQRAQPKCTAHSRGRISLVRRCSSGSPRHREYQG